MPHKAGEVPRPGGHVHCVRCDPQGPPGGADRRKPPMKALALKRRAMLDERLDASAPLEQRKALLRYHGGPGICRHGGGDVGPTEYSMMDLPAHGRVRFYHGDPCRGEYREVTLGREETPPRAFHTPASTRGTAMIAEARRRATSSCPAPPA